VLAPALSLHEDAFTLRRQRAPTTA